MVRRARCHPSPVETRVPPMRPPRHGVPARSIFRKNPKNLRQALSQNRPNRVIPNDATFFPRPPPSTVAGTTCSSRGTAGLVRGGGLQAPRPASFPLLTAHGFAFGHASKAAHHFQVRYRSLRILGTSSTSHAFGDNWARPAKTARGGAVLDRSAATWAAGPSPASGPGESITPYRFPRFFLFPPTAHCSPITASSA